jgi:hypothetical protein
MIFWKNVVGLSMPELLPLDYRFESLDRVEKLYGLVLDGTITSPVNSEAFATRLGSYIGETLLKQIGGKRSVMRRWDCECGFREVLKVRSR